MVLEDLSMALCVEYNVVQMLATFAVETHPKYKVFYNSLVLVQKSNEVKLHDLGRQFISNITFT